MLEEMTSCVYSTVLDEVFGSEKSGFSRLFGTLQDTLKFESKFESRFHSIHRKTRRRHFQQFNFK